VRLLTIALVLALALVGAGCGGGDDESSGDTTNTTTEETFTFDTTEDTETDETDTDATDGLATGECQELVDASTQLSQAFGSAGASGDLGDSSEFFDEFADRAPEEIRGDFQILAEAYSEYADALGDVDLQSGVTPSAEDLQALQEALRSIDQEEVTAASQRIADWATENC
jgi:hypothetical protein